jgi:putative transposase
MKTSRFTEPQILAILRQAEGGVPVPELCREHGMSTASFYKWRSKYGGMDASMISQMKALEDENRRLKKMYAEMSMQAELSTPRDGRESSGVARGEHCACLPHLRGQRDLLSLQRQAERRERADRRSPDRTDAGEEDLGLWPVLRLSAECPRTSLEPQAYIASTASWS